MSQRIVRILSRIIVLGVVSSPASLVDSEDASA